MRAAVGVVLLSGLLASLAEGYSISYPQLTQQVSKGGLPQWYKSDQSTSQDNDKLFISEESTEDGDLWISDDDPDWTLQSSQESQDHDGSFIAPESTEEGELWASGDDPDYEPSQSQEDESYDEYDDYSDEDYSQEDQDNYTDESYSQEDQDDYTGESYSQEDQDYTDEDFSQDDTQQSDDDQDTHPYPGIIVVPNAELQEGDEFWPQQDGWPVPDQYTDITVNEVTRSKRHTEQSRYQTQGQVVQKPAAYETGQVVQVPASYETGQVVQRPAAYETGQVVQVPGSYETGQVVQVPAGYENDRDRATLISVNVEPLLPVDGPHQHEVAAGVEPEHDGEYEGTNGGGSSIGRWWRRFRGNVEHTVGHIGDKLEDTVDNIGDKLHQTFHGLTDKVASIVQRFKVLMKKFGLVVQEGIHYCLRRFEHSRDQVQEMQVIEKLEKKLEEGHAEVAKFFQILGEKIKVWKVQHSSENIDTGLLEGYTQTGQNQQRVSQQHQNIEQQMPDFFQDSQVIVQLNKLRDEGLLSQNDIIILTEDHDNLDHQHQHQHHHEQNQNHDTQQQTQQNYDQQNYNQQHQTTFKPDYILFPESE